MQHGSGLVRQRSRVPLVSSWLLLLGALRALRLLAGVR
jgi:hypothetical protein